MLPACPRTASWTTRRPWVVRPIRVRRPLGPPSVRATKPRCSDRPENADAAIQALREAPGRSVFCYGAIGPDITPEITRVRAQLPDDGMALGLRGPQLSTMDDTAADVALARELGLRVSVHVHGATGWPSGRRPVAGMRERGLLDDRTTFVHANGLSDDQVAMLADAGCSVSISPDVELKMGLGWPETGRMLAAGIRPSLSIDDCPSVGGDMFSTMRTAFSVQRGLVTGGGLTARDVLGFATVEGARACGLDARTGSITVGKDADLVLLDAEDPSIFPVGNPVGTIVAAGHPGWWTVSSSRARRSSGVGGCSAWICRRCAAGSWSRVNASRRRPASRSADHGCPRHGERPADASGVCRGGPRAGRPRAGGLRPPARARRTAQLYGLS